MSSYQSYTRIILSLGALTIGAGACELIAAVDRTKIPPDNPILVGGGGMGGTTTVGGGGTGGIGGDGGGGAPACDPDECPSGPCTAGVCNPDDTCGTPEDLPSGTTCEDTSDPDARVCDGAGMCVECLTDGDCGGDTPVCDMDANTCVNAQCTNGMQDADETGVDCGGPTCGATCAVGEGCGGDGTQDCITGVCTGGMCAECTVGGCPEATEYCNTAAMNMGGMTEARCQPKVGDGDPCPLGTAAQCANANCVEGVCCDAACDSPCDSCVASKTGGMDGECLVTNAGQTSDAGTCTGECETNMCDGAATTCPAANEGNTCGMTVCGGAGDNQIVNSECTSGTCTPQGPMNCPGNEKCDSNACPGAGSCMSKNDCLSGFYCDSSNNCVPEVANGMSCTAADVCATCAAADPCVSTAFCVEGVCCDSACSGDCQSCLAANTAEATDGICAVANQLAQVAGSCDGMNACDGAGTASANCKLANGQSCSGDATNCASGMCDTGGFCN